MVAQQAVPEVVEVGLRLVARPRVALRNIDLPQEQAVFGRRLPPMSRGRYAIAVEDRFRAGTGAVGGAGRNALLRRQLQPLVALGRHDDGRMRLLQRPRPNGNVVVAEVLAAPLERFALRPSLDDEVPRLREALAGIAWRDAQRQILLRHAADK